MKVGYARVSTEEQNLELQIDALKRAGCDCLFTDHGVTGSSFNRPGLDAALARAGEGDSLIVWRLDRLGRSLSKLVDLLTYLGKQKVEFISLNESINTSTPGGTLMFHMMAALAEFERSLISERTRAGMAAARARGKVVGRKHALSASQRSHALALLGGQPLSEVAREFSVHPRTLKRLLEREATMVARLNDAPLVASRPRNGVIDNGGNSRD